MPKVSVILPAYNVAEYISDCVNSILDQSFQDFEVICVDDGSTDATSNLLDSYARQDARFKVIHQKNQGPGVARNTGLDCASGEYVILLDSDDIFYPNLLSELLLEAENTNSDVVVCRSEEFSNSTGGERDAWWTINIAQIPPYSPFSPIDMQDFIFTAFVGWPWDKLYRRSFIEEKAIRFPALKNSEDLYFVFLSLAKAERISIVDSVLIKHRVNRSDSVSNSRVAAPLSFYESTCLLKSELKKDPVLYSQLSWGFLNWALSYLIWNIDTMTNPEGRSAIIDALKQGKLEELELGAHPAYFFSLDPANYARYLSLINDSQEGSKARAKHPSMGYVAEFFLDAKDKGFLTAFKNLLNWVKRKLAKQAIPNEHRIVKRAADYPPQHKQS